MSTRRGSTRPTWRAAIVLASIGLAVAGCSRDGADDVEAGAAVRSQPTPPAIQVMEMSLGSINDLVNSSDAGVVVHVDDVSAPRWNADDGQLWDDGPDGEANYTMPMEYRNATATVEQVVFSSRDMPVAPGDAITIRLWGSGEDDGAVVEVTDPPSTFNQISGEFVEGTRVLVLLALGEFPMREGLVPVVRLTGHFSTAWVLNDDGSARSLDRERNVPNASALISRIDIERQNGRQPETPAEAARTERNPLG